MVPGATAPQQTMGFKFQLSKLVSPEKFTYISEAPLQAFFGRSASIEHAEK